MTANGSPKILIVKLSAIGDVVHTLPALNTLRRHYPTAHITWLVEPAAAPLVCHHPALDRVLVCNRKTWLKGLRTRSLRDHARQAPAFVRQLRDTRYDLILDFQASLKGALWILLARAKRKIGFGRGMEHQEHSYLVLNHKIPMVSMEMHALDRGLAMLEAIGIPATDIAYQIPANAGVQKRVSGLLRKAGLREDRPAIAMNPMAKWKTKLWPLERFAELADRLIADFALDICFTGDESDAPWIDRIRSQMTHASVNLAGRTSLVELSAVYRQMIGVISTDTGPMHIAAAVDTPVVALFGPTAPWRTGPYGRGHRVVQAGLTCVPCFKRQCATLKCMRAISVDQVYDATVRLLGDALRRKVSI